LLLLLGTILYMLVIDGGSHDNGNGDTQNAIQDSNENEQWQGTKYEYVRDFILVPVANFLSSIYMAM
jgi:hypothetical protein